MHNYSSAAYRRKESAGSSDQPGVLECLLPDRSPESIFFGEHEINELRASFMNIWGLDVSDHIAIKSGQEEFGVHKARECATSLVLKLAQGRRQ